MYTFFQVTCGIEASMLPDWNKILLSSGLTANEAETFYRGFIKTGFFVHRNV
jgi:hypothetical protein